MLTTGQKRLCKSLFQDYLNADKIISCSDDLGYSELKRLTNASNHETVIQDIDRELFDLFTIENNKKGL